MASAGEWGRGTYMLKIRFLDFSKFNGKKPQGSTNIRVYQLIKYWPEADIYKYGENPDVMVFQKAYINPDWTLPEHMSCIKILDLCDPDWLGGRVDIRRTVDAVDAITCSSEAIRNFIAQFTDKPVLHIPDRFDMSVLPTPKVHKGKAKKVVWFGYAHNAENLKPAIRIIEEMGLKLTVIAEDDPIAHRWGSPEFKKDYKFVTYDETTIYQELQKADICIMPKGTRPQDEFKSNNKTVKAILAGLPVANDINSLELFIDPEQRNLWIKDKYDTIKEQYDCRKSVEELKVLIDEIKSNRR